jgi:cytochrome c peroxidase
MKHKMSLTRRALSQATASAAALAHVRFVAASTAAVFAISFVAMARDDAGLLKHAQELFRPLPKDMATPESPITKERAHLGRLLFFDPRLSVDANVSCATCHQPSLYGTDALPKSIGVRQRLQARNAPTVLNTALHFVNNWRGDRDSVEDQAVRALTAPGSSGQPDEQAVIDQLERIAGYVPLFAAAFPGDPHPMTVKNIGKAIGSYERTLVTPSPFDRYLAGNVNALSATARAGLEKFISTGCTACHNGAGVGGGMYQKFGVIEDYWAATGSQTVDHGRADVTRSPADLYLFKVPSLRNVAMTAPYFHDGSVATLPEAVNVMARVQLGVMLSNQDTRDIVAFLDSLTGDLPAEFATAPILPSTGVPLPK